MTNDDAVEVVTFVHEQIYYENYETTPRFNMTMTLVRLLVGECVQ